MTATKATTDKPFPGHETCYRRASKLLDWMGKNGHVCQTKNRKGITVRCHVSEEMASLIDALNQGDEQTIKAYLIDPRYIDVVHAN